MRQQQTTKAKTGAPYTPISAIQMFMEKAAKNPVPSHLGIDELTTWEIARGTAFQVLQLARFLGLVDEKGQPTDRYKQMRGTESERVQMLKEALHEAYSFVFDTLALETATWSNLVTLFKNKNPSFSETTADRAVMCFAYLAHLAGFSLSDDVVAKIRVGRRERQPTPRPVGRRKRTELEEQSTGPLSGPRIPEVGQPRLSSLIEEYVRALIERLPIIKVEPGVAPEAIQQAIAYIQEVRKQVEELSRQKEEVEGTRS